jgi:hypothetical protein
VRYGSDGIKRAFVASSEIRLKGARLRRWSGGERQHLDVAWTHHVEVPLIQRHQFGDVEPLSQSDDAGVRRAERRVRVLLDQLGGTGKIISVGLTTSRNSGCCGHRAKAS